MTKLFLHLIKLRELSARAQWRVDLRGAVEQRIIYFVSLSFLRVRHHRLEPMTPEYFLWQVTGPGLSGLSSRLDGSFEDGHDLESLREHLLSRHVIERRHRVDLVNDRCGPNEEEVFVLSIRAYCQFLLVLRQYLALLRGPGPDQLRPNRRSDDVALSHISDAEHEAEFTVSLANNGVPREQQRLRPLLWPAHLGEYDAHHEGLDHHAGYTLNAHDEYRLGTFFRGRSAAVADRVLGLDTEEETAGEGEDVVDAGRPVVLHLEGRKVAFFEVTVGEGDQPPDHREPQPGEHKRQAEAEQRPTPLGVHQGREDVLEEAQRPPRDAGLQHVAVAILQHGSATQFARGACSVTAPGNFKDFYFWKN